VGFNLGVDLGTTFVAAAISDQSQIEMVTLGDRSVVTPSVVCVREDGTVVTGEAASRRAASNPGRVAREFKRRLGDPTPIRLADSNYTATELLGMLLRDVVAKVTEAEGAAPERVMLTHPANWGAFRRGLFEEVPRLAGLTETSTITEPEAAAAYYAASRQLGSGDLVAVYDLGGGTFDATVVRKLPDGVETLGTPEGVERLGGIDFDQALYDFVNFSSDSALSELDARDPQTAVALARVRQDCVLAKEALSADTETLLPVFLPGRHFDVRITREKFESLVRAQIESTIGSLSRALRSAQVSPADLSAVLLVGGSSRIPLVSEMVSEEIGRPILVDTHPKYAVALGAATLAMMLGAPPGPPPGPPPGRPGAPPGRPVGPPGRQGAPQGRAAAPPGRQGAAPGRQGAPAGRPGAPPGRQGAPPGSPPGRQGPASGRPGGRPGGPVPPGRPGASAPRRGAPTGVGPAAPPVANRSEPVPAVAAPQTSTLGTKLALGIALVALAVAIVLVAVYLVHQFRTTALGGTSQPGHPVGVVAASLAAARPGLVAFGD